VQDMNSKKGCVVVYIGKSVFLGPDHSNPYSQVMIERESALARESESKRDGGGGVSIYFNKFT